VGDGDREVLVVTAADQRDLRFDVFREPAAGERVDAVDLALGEQRRRPRQVRARFDREAVRAGPGGESLDPVGISHDIRIPLDTSPRCRDTGRSNTLGTR
jgi:hypothetical protein